MEKIKILKILGIFIGLAFTLASLEPVHADVFNCSAGDVDCLIDAINAANANGEEDTINLEAQEGSTYTLTSPDPMGGPDGPTGLPSITSEINLNGNGATIQRSTADGTPVFRILHVGEGGKLTLDSTIIRNGNSESGGGIYSRSNDLTIRDSIISNNVAEPESNNKWGIGGGISAKHLIMLRCLIEDNRAIGGIGGGVDAHAATITGSTFARNQAIYVPPLWNAGGAVNGAYIEIMDSVLVHSHGMAVYAGDELKMTNSTVAFTTGRHAMEVNSDYGDMELTNVTAAFNEGGSVYSHASRDIKNSIFYGGDVPDCPGGPQCGPGGNNILDGRCDELQSGDITEDPRLGSFRYSNAPGMAHFPLLHDSPAIDAGDNDSCAPSDQLGNLRVDGDGDGKINCDIGAIEFQGANQPPIAICQDDTVTTEPGTCIAEASVDDGSYDPDGDPITLVQEPPGPYDLGDTDVTLTVTDDKGAFDTCEATVTVEDQEPPIITSVSANPNKLWPPNHKMVPVVLAVDASDNCDSVCQIISAESNEPVNGLGDGNTNTAPDWVITGDLTVKLRAERSGTGSGRIYTITVECTDQSGNSSTDTAKVTVPHDKGKKNNQNKKKKK